MVRDQLTTARPVPAEPHKLPRTLRRFDILFFLVCTVVSVDTIGSVAAHGGQAFTWIVILAIAFFAPSAMIIADLGTTMPVEGAPYVWVRTAFGSLAGAINNVLYWITNPIWLGATLTILAVSTANTFFGDGRDLTGPAFYGPALAFVWAAIGAAIVSLRTGKWVPTIGAITRVAVIGFFTVSVIVYGVRHGLRGFPAGAFSPTFAGFLALTPLLLFNFVGLELPTAASGEMTDPRRDLPYGIARSALISTALYAVPILGVLLVLPVRTVTGLGGFIDAMKQVFTVYGGAGAYLAGVMAIGFIITLFTSAATWIMGSDRALAVSGSDGTAPRGLGRFHPRLGTPVRANVLSGLIATVTCVLAHELTGDADRYFSAGLNLAISTTLLSYLGIYPAYARIRRTHPAPRSRALRDPRAADAATALVTGFLLLGAVAVFWPGVFTPGLPDGGLPGGWHAADRGTFELLQLVPITVFVGLGVWFHRAGRRR